MREKPRSYWLNKLEAEDVPCTPVYDMAEVFEDPHVKHMGMEIRIDRGNNGPPIRTVRMPLDYGDTKCPQPGPPPDLGQHNFDVLKTLGCNEAMIGNLKLRGVI